MNEIKGLRVFPKMSPLPRSEKEMEDALRSSLIGEIVCFSPGPIGTDAAQAAQAWMDRMSIPTKRSEIRLCETPERCVEAAMHFDDEEVLAVFWTCATHPNGGSILFDNPDILPFAFQETVSTDLQLATTEGNLSELRNGVIPRDWQISSHASPQLLGNLRDITTIIVDDNATAAKHCAEGLSQACITTEFARETYDLRAIHRFGNLRMAFFGGVTRYGASLLNRAFEDQRAVEKKPHCGEPARLHRGYGVAVAAAWADAGFNSPIAGQDF